MGFVDRNTTGAANQDGAAAAAEAKAEATVDRNKKQGENPDHEPEELGKQVRQALRLPQSADDVEAFKESLRQGLHTADKNFFGKKDGIYLTNPDDPQEAAKRKIILDVYRSVSNLSPAEQQKLNTLLKLNPDKKQIEDGINEILKAARVRLTSEMEELQADIADMEQVIIGNPNKNYGERQMMVQPLYDRLNALEQLNKGGSIGRLLTKGAYDSALDSTARQRLQDIKFAGRVF